jgi:ABC-type Fe3+/spermidine/putrescine transport system ATPase subunit
MNLLKVSGINKREGKDFLLQDISFEQPSLQKLAVAGATGSGKTTLLKIIGGRAQADSGQVFFENRRVPGSAERLIPGHAGIAYLSQHFELRNNYRVEDELSYMNNLSGKRAAALYEVCRIGHLLKRKTDQLSGGERQRIALARLLGSSPKLLLLDEPFSNLDPLNKNNLKTVIRDIGEKLKITCILVSHDPLDTLTWADEILVLQDGRLAQKGSPEQVYREPVNEYVAGLFGRYNLLSPEQGGELLPSTGITLNGQRWLIRPEDFQIDARERNGITVRGQVTAINFAGSYYEIEVRLPACTVLVSSRSVTIQKGQEVSVTVDPKKISSI